MFLTFIETRLDETRLGSVRLGQVAEQVLGRLGLAGARLAAHHNRLALTERAHVAVGFVADGEHVRRQGAQRLALVAAYRLARVQLRQLLVRIDGEQNVRHIRLFFSSPSRIGIRKRANTKQNKTIGSSALRR